MANRFSPYGELVRCRNQPRWSSVSAQSCACAASLSDHFKGAIFRLARTALWASSKPVDCAEQAIRRARKRLQSLITTASFITLVVVGDFGVGSDALVRFMAPEKPVVGMRRRAFRQHEQALPSQGL